MPYAILGLLCLISGITCHIWIPETKEATTLEVFPTKSEEGQDKDNHPQAHENQVAIS